MQNHKVLCALGALGGEGLLDTQQATAVFVPRGERSSWTLRVELRNLRPLRSLYGRNGWATSTISHQRPAASRFQSRR